MHVAINARYLGQSVTGVQRYAREVTASLRELVPPDRLTEIPVAALGGSFSLPGAGHLWEQTVLPLRAQSSGADVLLNLTNWSPIVGRLPSVVVVHDDISALLPECYTRGYRSARRVYLRLLRMSNAHVVTVSAFSRRQLERVLGREVTLAPGGVRVPDEALEDGFAQRALSRFGLAERSYALLVGAHDRRKNWRFARDLVAGLGARGLQLVGTARSGSASLAATSAAVKASSGGGRILLDVSDRELWGLYAGAAVVLHPSLAEGFGLPLLEAAAVGTPFLTTEVGAAADLAVGRRQLLRLSPDDWLRGIDWVQHEREALASALVERAQQYTWAKCASALLEACHSALRH